MMTNPLLLASFHPRLGSFGVHHAYGYGYGAAHGSGWITHMIVSSLIHGLIYGAIFHILRHLSLGEILLLVAVALWALYAWNRRRPTRW